MTAVVQVPSRPLHAEPGTHEYHVPRTGKQGWHKIADYDDFVKYQYSDTAYRVVVHKNDRGHFEARFMSWYDGPTYLIRGNCGGDKMGRLKALVAAHEFIDENEYGCPPPGNYE